MLLFLASFLIQIIEIEDDDDMVMYSSIFTNCVSLYLRPFFSNQNEVNQVDEENQYIVEEADEENQVEAENEEAQISENEEFVIQEQPKKLIMSDVWEQYLTTAEIRKEDMNRLVMNFLVVEGYLEAVEKFQKESGTKRILFQLVEELSQILSSAWCVIWSLLFP